MLPHFDQNQPVSYHEGKKCIVFIMFYLFIFNITPLILMKQAWGNNEVTILPREEQYGRMPNYH